MDRQTVHPPKANVPGKLNLASTQPRSLEFTVVRNSGLHTVTEFTGRKEIGMRTAGYLSMKFWCCDIFDLRTVFAFRLRPFFFEIDKSQLKSDAGFRALLTSR